MPVRSSTSPPPFTNTSTRGVASFNRSARQLAADAALRAESSFAQYLREHPPPERAIGWAHWISVGNRLWYAADVIAAAPNHDEPAATTRTAAERLATGYDELAASLRGRRSPLPPAEPQPRSLSRSSELAAWLDDLAAVPGSVLR